MTSINRKKNSTKLFLQISSIHWTLLVFYGYTYGLRATHTLNDLPIPIHPDSAQLLRTSKAKPLKTHLMIISAGVSDQYETVTNDIS